MEIVFKLKVILKDRRTWELERSYSEFNQFKWSLPFGCDSHFANKYPHPSIFDVFSISDQNSEYKRQRLEEWIRELCLDEKCIMNPSILRKLYAFVKAEEHGGAVGLNSQPPVVAPYKRYVVPPHEITVFPMSYDVLSTSLPCFIQQASLQFSGESFAVSDEQLVKDLERDRIVVQGKRLVGSHCKFAKILEATVDAVNQILSSAVQSSAISPAAREAIRDEDIVAWCKLCLKRSSRTDASALCHSALAQILSLTDAVVVPESTLAKPVELHFFLKIKQQKPSPQRKNALSQTAAPTDTFSIACDVRNCTVYRIADMETLETRLQISATYFSVLLGLGVMGARAAGEGITVSKAVVVFEKETTTTNRDW